MAPLTRPALLPAPAQAQAADALARYAATRDAEAFRTLVDEHRGMVESTCAGVLGRRSPDLDDAVQETFAKLARFAPAIHGNVGAWLCRCARTTSLDRWRTRRERSGGDELAEQLACRAPDHAHDEQLHIVRECLAELPERPRLVLHAYFFEHRTQREIARGLGVSQVAVQKRLTAALDLLRSRCVRRGVGAASLALLLGGGADGATDAPRPRSGPAPGPSGLTVAFGALLGSGLIIGVITALAGAPTPPIRTHAAAEASRDAAPAPEHAAPAPAQVQRLASLDDHAAWIVAGNLPTAWDGARALIMSQPPPGLIATDAEALVGGGMRSAHAWPLTASPLTLRLAVDIPAGGRLAIIAAAFASTQEAPGRDADAGMSEIYWQSTPLLRGPASMDPCLSELGGKVFTLVSSQPQTITTTSFAGGDIRTLPPGRHEMAISVATGSLRTAVDGRTLYRGTMPVSGHAPRWIRFQFGVLAPALDKTPARSVLVTSAVVEQGD